MRTLKLGALFILLLAMCATRAKADTYESTFTGTITQAPAGNIFDVAVGAPIGVDIFFPPSPCVISSYPPSPCSVNSFTITLDIGPDIYSEVLSPSGNTGSVTLSDGLITGIQVTYPPVPCASAGPAGPPDCPALTVSGASFFTSSSTICEPGQVCGTLDFAGSVPVETPEPPTILLLAIGLIGLMYCYRKASRSFQREVATGLP
jgi:hypothetical protein